MNTSNDRPSVASAIEALLSSFTHAVRNQPEVRRALHELGRWLVDQTRADVAASNPFGAGHGAASSAPSSATPQRPSGASPFAPRVVPVSVSTVEREVRVGDARVTTRVAESAGGSRIEAADLTPDIRGPRVVMETPTHRRADLGTIARRARLKAEAARWVAHRNVALETGDMTPNEAAEHGAELIRQARSMDSCWLWMLDPSMPSYKGEDLTRIAENYETLALAAEIAQQVPEAWQADPPDDVLCHLIAEAQSSVRAALLDIDLRNDTDQLDLYWWLRDQTAPDRLFIRRFMKTDDPANPDNWADLRNRLEAWLGEHRRESENERERRNLLGKVRYHVNRAVAATDEAEMTEEWSQAGKAMAEWVSRGLPPSDRALCDLLVPYLDRIPEELELPDEAERVIDAADVLAESRERVATVSIEGPAAARSAEVEQAARLLRGKVAVLIGGSERPLSKRMLERDLGLKEIRWLASRPHESLDSFIPEITRPDVDLVMLMIRFSSHSYGDLAEICARHNKPFVRLPSGYGSSQVAHQVLQQVSERLRTEMKSEVQVEA